MMKSKKLGYFVLGTLFLLLSVIVFVIPTIKTEVFWIGYIFTVIAFALQIVIWNKTFKRKNVLKSKYLGLPVVHVSIVYLIIQIIVLVLFTMVSVFPKWSAVVVCVLILSISIVCMLTGEVGREEIESVEAKIERKVFYTKQLQIDVEMLANAETNEKIKLSLQQLAETIRFSDPMSNETLAEIENLIVTKINELKTVSDKTDLIQAISSLLVERNKKCKMIK